VLMAFMLWCGARSVPLIEADVDERVSRLLQNEQIDWVQVEVFGRNVQLFGIAPSEEARERVVAAVDDLAAVTLTADRLAVVVPTAGEADPRQQGLSSPPDATPSRLVLAFDGTRLTLTGQLGDEQSTAAILRQAEQRYTRDGVITELTLTESSSLAWRGAASSAVAALALLDTGRAELADGRLTVSGAAPDATTLGALLDVLESRTPTEVALRANVVPIYKRGRPDPDGCRRALQILIDAGEVMASGEFSGLSPTTRTTLDQIARLMQSCAAGLLVVAPAAADGDGAPSIDDEMLAQDVRRYLLSRGIDENSVARANAPPGTLSGTGVALNLVLPQAPTTR
jgi:hypothetical protein